MPDMIVGRLVYEVTQVGLAQLKRELAELAADPIRVTPEVSPQGKRAVAELDDEMRRLRNRVTGLRNEFASSGGDIGRYTQNLKAAQREALELAKGHDRSSRAFVHLTGTAASAQRGIVAALRAQTMAVTPLQERIARLQNEVHGLRNQYIAVGGPSDRFASSMRRVRDEALEAARGLATTSKEFRQLQTVAAQAERAATQAMGGVSRLGLASQVRAGMGGFFGPGGVGTTAASAIGIIPGIVGQTAYFGSIFARDLTRMNVATAAATTGTLALGMAMGVGTAHAARLQQQQRLLEAITLQNVGSYKELTRGILDLSTVIPATTRELFEASEEAAKLGVDGAQNILAFTRSIQGLAFVTRGDVGTLASEVAKFMNELGIGPTSPNYISELDGVTNALAAVHTWSAATAQETITLSRYFAAIATQVGLTAPQIVALSGSLAALGGQAQSSGTNLASFFLDMARAADRGGRRLEGMARIAGMSVREFRALVRSDIVEAFLRIAGGLNEAHGSAENFARAMDAIGADNMRLIRVLGQASVGQETFLTILEQVNNAQREKNYLDNVLSEATDNLIDQTRLWWNALRAVWALMGTPVVEQLTNQVARLRERTQELLARFQALSDEQLRAVSIAGELVLGVAGTVVAFSALNGIMGIVMSGFRTLVAIGALVFSPTILWIAGITAAVVLLRQGWDTNWHGMRDSATGALDVIRDKWDSVKEFIFGREFILPPIGPGAEGGTVHVGGLINSIRERWEDFTLPDKVLDGVKVTAGIVWAFTFARSFASALARSAGLSMATARAATRGGGVAGTVARYAFRLGAVAVLADLVWDFVPESVKEKVDQFWNGVADEIRTFNAETIDNPLVGKFADWLEGLGTEDWELPALTVGAAFAAFKLLQTGSAIARMLGMVVAGAIAQIALPITVAGGILVALGLLTMSDEEKAKVKADIQEIWNTEELSLTLRVGKIALVLLDSAIQNIVDELDEKVFDPVGQIVGTRPTEEGKELQRILMMSPEERAAEAASLRERLGPTYFERPPTMLDRIVRSILNPPENSLLGQARRLFGGSSEANLAEQAVERVVAGIPRLQEARAELEAIASRYIDLTEGAGLQDVMEFLSLVVSESGLTVQTLKDSMENPARMTAGRMQDVADKLSDVNDRLEGAIVLWNELRDITESAAQAAALYKLPGLVSLVGFDSTVRAVDLFPELAGTDMANLSPREIQKRFNEIYEYIGGKFHGAIIPGGSGPDQYLAMVAPGEAIVPAKDVQGGWPAVLAWFRKMGVPGFQQGKAPVFGAQVQGALDYANEIVANTQEHSITEQIKQGFVESLQLLGSVLEQGGKAIFGEEFYNRGRAFIDDLMSALSILVGGAPPSVPTATLVVPGDDPDDPEDTKGLWERFLDWLKVEWETTLSDAISGKLGRVSPALGGLFDLARGSFGKDGGGFGAFIGGIGSMLAGGIASFVIDSIVSANQAAAASAAAAVQLSRELAQVNQLGTQQDVLGIRQQFESLANVEANREALREAIRRRSSISAEIYEAQNPSRILGFATDRFGANAPARAAFIASRQADLAELNREISRLENAINNASPAELARALGVSADRFANAVQSAFSAQTFEDAEDGMGNLVEGFKTRLGSAVNDIIRSALIQRFIGDVIAQPISDLASKVFEDITSGAEPDMAQVQAAIEGIQEKSRPFYDMLERLGLTGNETAEALNRTMAALRNVPSGFRVALARFESTAPIPALATGGYVPATPGGRIVRLAEGGEGEFVVPESRMRSVGGGPAINLHFNAPVYGFDDFRRKVEGIMARADAQLGLTRRGLTRSAYSRR